MLYVLYAELAGSLAYLELLQGPTRRRDLSNAYMSYLIGRLLPVLVKQPVVVNATIASVATASSVVYVDLDLDAQLTLRPHGCNATRPADNLYTAAYVHTLLQHALASHSPSISAASHWILVDCSFDGLVISDTTIVKLHIVDRAMTTFSTFLVQTLAISRPKLHRSSPGGAAMLLSVPLAAMAVSLDGRVTSTAPSVYNVFAGLEFPYEWSPFERVVLDEVAPASAEWHASIASTGERILLRGMDGFYRNSDKASVGSYYWDLPADNPALFAKKVQFYTVYRNKDSWAWFRCFLGLWLGAKLATNAAIAAVVMANSSVGWLPDLGCTIQSEIVLRTGLLLGESVWNTWWYPLQYSLNEGGVRTKWSGTLVGSSSMRAEGLMVVLTLMHFVGRAARVHVHVGVVVFVYVGCFAHRLAIVNACGVFLDRGNELLKKNYFDSIFAGPPGGMDMWMQHEMDPAIEHAVVVLNEFTWLLVAFAVLVGYAFVAKLVAVSARPPRGTRTSQTASLLFDISHRVSVVSPATPSPPDAVAGHKHVHWLHLSSLYDASEIDVVLDNTHMERSVGRIASSAFGLVLPWDLYTGDGHLSEHGMWLLGHVVVAGKFVVRVHDVAPLVVNVLLQTHVFTVFAFELSAKGMSSKQVRVLPTDLRRMQLWRLAVTSMK